MERLERIDGLRQEDAPAGVLLDEVRALLSQAEDWVREAVEILEENFGDLVFKTRIKKTVRYAEAPVKGSSVLKYDPSGNAAEAYRELAKEVLNGAKARQHA